MSSGTNTCGLSLTDSAARQAMRSFSTLWLLESGLTQSVAEVATPCASNPRSQPRPHLPARDLKFCHTTPS